VRPFPRRGRGRRRRRGLGLLCRRLRLPGWLGRCAGRRWGLARGGRRLRRVLGGARREGRLGRGQLRRKGGLRAPWLGRRRTALLGMMVLGLRHAWLRHCRLLRHLGLGQVWLWPCWLLGNLWLGWPRLLPHCLLWGNLGLG